MARQQAGRHAKSQRPRSHFSQRLGAGVWLVATVTRLNRVVAQGIGSGTRVHFGTTVSFQAYFADANPSAHENSRNSSFGGDTLRYVRTETKGSSSAFGSMDVIRSSRTPGDVNLMRSRTVN